MNEIFLCVYDASLTHNVIQYEVLKRQNRFNLDKMFFRQATRKNAPPMALYDKKVAASLSFCTKLVHEKIYFLVYCTKVPIFARPLANFYAKFMQDDF